MNRGAVLALIVVAGYVAFELLAVRKNAYRMTPAHIFVQYAEAAHAQARCGDAEPSPRFARNFDYVRQRALAAATSASAPGDISIADAERAAQARVEATIAADGCDALAVWKLLKRYTNLARQNPPGTRRADRGA